MDIYLPGTVADLSKEILGARSGFCPNKDLAQAANTDLSVKDGAEVIDNLAFQLACEASLLILTATDLPYRVVFAVTIEATQIDEVQFDVIPGELVVKPVAWSQVRAIFVDDDENSQLVQKALANPDDDSIKEELWSEPPLWFDVSELSHLRKIWG